MRRLRDVPIRRKMTAIIMLIVAAALALATAVAMTIELAADREDLAGDLATTAQMAGDAAAAAITFNDPVSARTTLQALAADPHIVAAALYDARGRLFVAWQPHTAGGAAAAMPPPGPDSHRFSDDSLEVFRGIDVAGEKVGVVYIRSNLDAMTSAMRRYAGATGLALALALAAGYLMSAWLQRLVTAPITHLAGVVGAVTRTKDYSARALPSGGDELGQLIAGFNDMLGQIEERDRALRASRDQLEERVSERTAQLQQANEALQAENAERARAERALRTFRDAVEQCSDGIYIVDPTAGRILDCNAAAAASQGYTHEELRALCIPQLDPTLAEPTQWLAMVEALRAAGALTIERQSRRKDGSMFPVEVSGRYVAAVPRDYMIAVVRDISARKQAEARLTAAQAQLLEVTRAAGMAEVATNVLHNVGNALNSVNVSVGLIRTTLGKGTAAGLARVVDLMRGHEADLGNFLSADPQGQRVLPYLGQLVEAFRSDHAALTAELQGLTRNVDHIKEVVAMQQRYARVGAVEESVDVAALVEDCLAMNAEALTRRKVTVVRELAGLPSLKTEKHKLLQILMNLVSNAAYACEGAAGADPCIVVRGSAAACRLRIEVTDNGVGISPENLARIFEYGFTTRKAGHGFGLHGGALAARSMGGSLSVRSDGPGKGATFTLELPL